jgi:hypothetical protein
MQHGPGDSRKLVGERYRQHILVQSLRSRCEPPGQAKFAPAIWSEKKRASPLNEQGAEISIAPAADASQDGSIPGGDLLGYEAEPGGEVASLTECRAVADCGYHRAGNHWSDAGCPINRLQFSSSLAMFSI